MGDLEVGDIYLLIYVHGSAAAMVTTQVYSNRIQAPDMVLQVCITDNTWLVGKREQANVRKDRCITTDNGEVEPWFFSFRKVRS